MGCPWAFPAYGHLRAPGPVQGWAALPSSLVAADLWCGLQQDCSCDSETEALLRQTWSTQHALSPQPASSLRGST